MSDKPTVVSKGRIWRAVIEIEFEVPEDYGPSDHVSGDPLGYAYAYETWSGTDSLEGFTIIDIVDANEKVGKKK